ncbi:hypothetical protein [Mycobacterium lacus]|uniref:hypothetical protein n=1 Tax=Mycobacterium lacus TaxID=169765 RepID=UPI0022AB0A13|nr:hypothetical protein [Mycobacterium lacus]
MTAALGFAALAITTKLTVVTRCAGFAALAITTKLTVVTRCARLRRACDHHEADGGDPLRPASPRLRSPRS